MPSTSFSDTIFTKFFLGAAFADDAVVTAAGSCGGAAGFASPFTAWRRGPLTDTAVLWVPVPLVVEVTGAGGEPEDLESTIGCPPTGGGTGAGGGEGDGAATAAFGSALMGGPGSGGTGGCSLQSFKGNRNQNASNDPIFLLSRSIP